MSKVYWSFEKKRKDFDQFNAWDLAWAMREIQKYTDVFWVNKKVPTHIVDNPEAEGILYDNGKIGFISGTSSNLAKDCIQVQSAMMFAIMVKQHEEATSSFPRADHTAVKDSKDNIKPNAICYHCGSPGYQGMGQIECPNGCHENN